MNLSSRVEKFFSSEGPLKKVVEDYQPRQGQVDMSKAIAEHVSQKKHLIVEAATGVGKSYAYLVPLLLLERRKHPIVISTGTIALQEQLVEKDLPNLIQCFDKPIEIALAKGRGHYLCENRFKKALPVLETIAEDETDLITLKKLSTSVGKTFPLTYSDLPGPLSQSAWTHIASESGLCGHKICREHPCSFLQARLHMKKADVIVVNHSLLFVHLSLNESGVSLLPEFRYLVLDEAHHCPDIATEQFGVSASNGRIKYYLDRLYNPRSKKGFLARINPMPKILLQAIQEIRNYNEEFFSSLKFWRQTEGPENGRLRKPEPFDNLLTPKLEELINLLDNWAASADHDDEQREFRVHAEKARVLKNEIEVFLNQRLGDAAYWVDMGSEHAYHPQVLARAAHLDVSARLRDIMFDKAMTVIMTSATLRTSANDAFAYYCKRMGAEEVDTMSVESSFNYDNNVGLLTFPSFASPKEDKFEEFLPKIICRLIDLTQGGVFILVTSYTLLKRLHESIREHTEGKGYPLLAQGIHGSRSAILKEFRKSSSAVLLGNQSFWEGVDVPGPSLRNVIITKLPFEVPSHPLQEARYEAIEERGGSSFRELAMPQAVMRFKQGFGRLIRKSSDLGIVCVLDSRIHTKAYGRDFLAALPNCKSYVGEKPEDEFLRKILPEGFDLTE